MRARLHSAAIESPWRSANNPSYIIDNYDSLPDNILFIHPNRYQWHNDDPDYDGLPMLRRLQLPFLEEQGYVNIRCAWSLGCPAEIKPLAEEGEHREAVHAGGDYKKAFQTLFPDKAVPKEVGVSCCAQFAATREKIWEKKKSEYQRYRQWLLDTELGDSISGRVLEYSWHSKFAPNDPRQFAVSLHQFAWLKSLLSRSLPSWRLTMCRTDWRGVCFLLPRF
jgi:hypothetical protein